jgi:carbon-monoxide dehydrogenase medium subunit
VIPAAFDYVRPGSVDEAVGALAEHGDEAKVLAGGQSLIPLLRLRLAYPSVLVDVGRLAELRGVRDDGDSLVVGAATPHHEVMTDPLVREHVPLVAEATATVADPAVRHRGTFGGALAHADPAGDLPAVALALGAVMVVAGPAGRRQVPAGHFFQDYCRRTCAPTSCSSPYGCRSPARRGVTGTRSSTGSRRRGRSWVWRPWCAATTVGSPRRGSR